MFKVFRELERESPVLRAERRHQTSAIRRAFVVTRVLVMLCAGITLALTIMELISAATPDGNYRLTDYPLPVLIVAHFLPSLVLLPFVTLFHFSAISRTLTLAANCIAREKHGATWELLLLTDQRPAQIVLGKWWATVQTLAPGFLLLAALRWGVTLYLGLERYRIDYFYSSGFAPPPLLDVLPVRFPVTVGSLVIGAVVITGLTLVNLLFTAAVGVLISALRQGGERIAAAFVLRGVILALPALGLIALSTQAADAAHPLLPVSGFDLSVGLFAFGTSLIDNGARVAAAWLVHPRFMLNFGFGRLYTYSLPPYILPVLFAFYVAVAAISLWAAAAVVRRSR